MLSTSIITKSNMTQVYDQDGNKIAATIVNAQPVFITAQRTVEKDGYQSTQIGWNPKKSVHKPTAGKLKKAGIEQQLSKYLEVKTEESPEIGTAYSILDIIEAGDIISVQGVTKGKGFAGVVKRWGFAGGPKTHGQTDRHRAPGSIGAGTYPGRVLKGKKMAGRMGGTNNTITNLTVLAVDKQAGTMVISGSIPGSRNSDLIVTKTGTRKNFTPLQTTVVEDQTETDQTTTESTDNNSNL